MKIEPLGDRIMVRRDESDKVTAGGIVIPGNSQGKSNRGVVVAAGPGVKVDGKSMGVDVAEGDKILFGKYSGVEVEVDGEALFLMREEEVLAIIRD